MAEVRKSPTKHAWMLVFQAPVIIVGIGAIGAAANDLIAMRTGLTVFGAAFAASVAGSVRFMRSYRCPECRQRLLPPRGWWHRFLVCRS